MTHRLPTNGEYKVNRGQPKTSAGSGQSWLVLFARYRVPVMRQAEAQVS